MTEKSSEEANAAYRIGLCVTCLTEPHSAGRPRCEACHKTHVIPYEPGLRPPMEATK